MKPCAIFAFNWPEAGGEYFNVFDPLNTVYAHGSTISKSTAIELGLELIYDDRGTK